MYTWGEETLQRGRLFLHHRKMLVRPVDREVGYAEHSGHHLGG